MWGGRPHRHSFDTTSPNDIRASTEHGCGFAEPGPDRRLLRAMLKGD
jgi:hypothetical protein